MPGGLTGKILRVNLTTKEISTIASEKYADYGGGHGMGSALFFDLVGNQLPFPAFDPRNVIIMTASPFAGTFVPGSGRCEVQGLGPMLYPVEWFGHSNFGGRFTAQLKFAGWDAIAVEGASDEPVWINIVNDQVKIESARGIWGKNTWEDFQAGYTRPPDGRMGGTCTKRLHIPGSGGRNLRPCGREHEPPRMPASWSRIPGCVVRIRRRFRFEKTQGDQRTRHRQRAYRRSQGIHGCQALVPPVPVGCG